VEYEAELRFVQKLLEAMHITSCIITDYKKEISSKIDAGLRAKLFGVDDYKGFFQNSMGEAKPNTIYRFFDEYYCNYIFMRLPESESFFYIGPYLPVSLEQEKIKETFKSRKMDSEHQDFLFKYYNSLPVVDDENILFAIVNTLGENLWGSKENFTFEYVEYAITDKSEPIEFSPVYTEEEKTPLSLSILEENYANEKRLMKAVSQGKLNKIGAIASVVYNNSTEQRNSDSLRNRKNYLIILNTVLRCSAENGGVHPLHIDRLSSIFARKIERIYTIEESKHLQNDMIRSYCILVKDYSLKNYSYLIGKTLTLISYDLTDDLSLKSLSKKLSVNPTYLSALFKKECGCTLTNYVNSKRVEYAITLLKDSGKLVGQIASECGIDDTNYFIRLFKKHTGLTPNEYRRQFGKK